MNDPILVLYALLAMAIGMWLFIFCIQGVCDPFWSRATRRISAVGVIVGAATFVIGAGGMMVAL